MSNNFNYAEYMKASMKRQLEQIKYCAFCGKPVLPYGTDESGYANRNVDWEMQYSAHWECYTKSLKR